MNYALKVNKLQEFDEDLYEDAVYELIRCLGRFDESRGVKWTTYAVRSIVLYVRREKARRQKASALTASEDATFYRVEDAKDMDAEITSQWVVEDLFANLTAEQKEVARLKYQGYNNNEIKRNLGISSTKLNRILQEVRRKAQKLHD